MAPAPMIAIFIALFLSDVSCQSPSGFGRREQLSAAKARMRGHFSAWRDFHRAILELRYLPDRIQRRVGQHVGSGLVIAERDEDRALRRAFVSARVQGDPAA